MSIAQPSPLPPYAAAMGIVYSAEENGVPILAMPFGDHVQGRPGYLHGGAISGLLEMAAFATLRAHLDAKDSDRTLKPINVSIQFLRGGKSQTTLAAGRIHRLGRRNAHVLVEAWQDDRESPIASAVMNVLIAPPAG
ncbi:PaaI family thioesterase [Altererythrobacter aquiaggeris]|uniref:PaaI family thioesterase n=1 Tax=Aestuarierythrobacter aquiaggeris TaxID=1898396 RepID=UPI003019D21D